MQQCYMHRFVQKPMTIKTIEVVTHLMEINGYLSKIPPANSMDPAPTKLPGDKVLDILEFGILNSWQKQMVL